MTGIILQARMGSSRLPGKVMMPICKRPMLGHILDRLKSVENADIVIVATTTKAKDDVIASFTVAEGVACFRGSESDVIDRYYQAALQFGLDHIVRATADNPFVDPEETERLIALHLATSADYSHAFGKLPIGVGTECFTREALSTSWQKGHLPHHREHVDEYILEHPEIFRTVILDIPPEKDAPAVRLTVDTPEDFARAASIYDRLYRAGNHVLTQDAIKLCTTQSA